MIIDLTMLLNKNKRVGANVQMRKAIKLFNETIETFSMKKFRRLLKINHIQDLLQIWMDSGDFLT